MDHWVKNIHTASLIKGQHKYFWIGVSTMKIALEKNNTDMKLKRAKIMDKVGDYWTAGIFLLIVIVFTIIEPNFFTTAYWSSTLVYLSEILLLAIGETFVIITGGIDLSVGAVEGFVGVASAILIRALVPVTGSTMAIIIGVACGLLMGLIIGAVNGLIITKMKITPFIATLGTMGILQGFGFIMGKGTDIVGLPIEMGEIGNIILYKMFGFSTIVSWLVAIIGYIMISKMRFGVYTYSIGSNAEASRRAGINVDRHLIKVYMLASLTAALAGLLMILRFNTASPLTGANVNLNAVAGVVIGGTSVMGGSGGVIGSVIGAGIISILVTGLVMIDVTPFWQTVSIGVIIIVAVYIDQIRNKQ